MIEKVYTVSLSKLYAMGRHTERARKSVKMIRKFASRHMKTEDEKVIITQEVNEYLWRNGIQKPPKRLRVKLMKDKDGTVMVALESEQTKQVEKKNEEQKGKLKRKINAKAKDEKKREVSESNKKEKAKPKTKKESKVQSKDDKT